MPRAVAATVLGQEAGMNQGMRLFCVGAVIASSMAGCAADEPVHLFLRESDRAVRHMTLDAHFAEREVSLPPADEFANFVDGQTLIWLTSVRNGVMVDLRLAIPRDVLTDPAFAVGSTVTLSGDALVLADRDTYVGAYVSDPVLRAAVQVCEGTWTESTQTLCCYDEHPASSVELVVSPCETPGRVHVTVHAILENAADGTPQSADASFDLGPS